MHRSRLSSILIDCATNDYERGIEFWSRALGKEVVPEDEPYTSLKGRVGGEGGLVIGLQRVARGERAKHAAAETITVPYVYSGL